ncbi:hypothetical protein CUMW_238840, partial [Citrus unshiu]
IAIGLKTVWTLRIAPRHQSIYIKILFIRIFSNEIVTPHQSMPHHRFVYLNSVVKSSVDNTVHMNSTIYVNSDIFPFMLLLRFLTVLSSKVISVLPFDFSFILK